MCQKTITNLTLFAKSRVLLNLLFKAWKLQVLRICMNTDQKLNCKYKTCVQGATRAFANKDK